SAILEDSENRIMAKDDAGNPVGVRNFNEIYSQVVGPKSDGSVEIEYAEQATLGFLGDCMWSLDWFFANGFLGFPRQVTRAVLQALGVSFLLEAYYRSWLVTILDQFNQRGLIPGYITRPAARATGSSPPKPSGATSSSARRSDSNTPSRLDNRL